MEVRTDDSSVDEWLLARGFARGATGWWSKSMPVHERAGLLGEIGRQLNGQVRDVIARDVERLQQKAAEEHR